MPRMDGTGPAGQGPGTGRGMGPCGTSGSVLRQSGYSRQSGWLGAVTGILGAFGRGDNGAGGGAGRGRGQGRRRSAR